MRNSRQPNTCIGVCIYAHNYAYTTYVRMPHWYVWGNVHVHVLFLLVLKGQCCFQWLDSLPQSKKEFSLFWICVYINYLYFQVMPYSTRCSTPLSNFESNQNYKETMDPSGRWSSTLIANTLLPLVLIACQIGTFRDYFMWYSLPWEKFSQKNWVEVCGLLLKTFIYLRPKSEIFTIYSNLFMASPNIWYPIYDLVRSSIPCSRPVFL